jgi:quercetin dioxygenase-like cupin family protein
MAHRIFEDIAIEAKHLTIQAGKSLAAHWTPKKAILICLQGEGIFCANGQEQLLTPGTMIVMSPQLRHAISAKKRCDILLLLQNDGLENI